MIDINIANRLGRYEVADVKSAIKLWATRHVYESKKSAEVLASLGWERVTAAPGSAIHDGRPVLWAHGQSWALRSDIHAEQLAAAFEAAENDQPASETKSVVGTESLSAMVCPRCGDSLQHTSVCPKCAAGKLGYRHRYSCVCGGVDLISKESL